MLDSAKIMEEMNENGFCVLHNAVEPKVLSEIYTVYLDVIGRHGSVGGSVGSTEADYGFAVDHPLLLGTQVLKIALNEALIASIAGYLNEQSCRLSYASAYRNIPMDMSPEMQDFLYQDGVFKGWHSDANLLVEERRHRSVVAMLYLSDVSPGGGGLWLSAKTHLQTRSKRNIAQSELEPSSIVEMAAPAGTLILFDMEMVHRAGTPEPGQPSRDIIRFMYSPPHGYAQQLIISPNHLWEGMSEEQFRCLGFSSHVNSVIELAPKRPASDEKTKTSGGALRSLGARALRHFVSKLAS